MNYLLRGSNQTGFFSQEHLILMKDTFLQLNVERIAVLSDEEAAKASGGMIIFGNGTMGCTGGGCNTSVTANGCTTEGCRPTSKGCTD